jgi:hypothetical protein
MMELLFLIIFVVLILNCIRRLVMGGIRRPANIVYVKVPYREFPHEEGGIDLANGKSEIFIPTSHIPRRVWISLEDFEGVQCCLGQVNKLSTYCTTEGFVLIAEISSESAYVKWIAEFA